MRLAMIMIVLALLTIPLEAAAVTSSRLPEARRYDMPPTTLQAVVVKNASWTSSYATVTAWERTSTTAPWVKRKAGPGRVGYNGIKVNRLQNSGQTPAGMYRFGLVLVPQLRTGVRLRQRVYTSSTYWVYDSRDPRTYNTIQEGHPAGALWRTSEAERLAAYQSQYDPAIVIGFNLPSPDKLPDVTKGGGIFLHVNGSGATAGCVSVPRDRMQEIMRWLDPSKSPRIIIGEDGWLSAS